MNRIIAPILILFLSPSCNRNIESKEQGNNIPHDDLQRSSSIKDVKDNEIFLDSVSFRDFEKLINKSVEVAEPIPIEWIRKFTNLSDSLITPESIFLGWWTNQEYPDIKLVYLDNYDSNYERKIFLTFNRKNTQVDEKIFSTRCQKCTSKELFEDVNFLSNTKKTNISVDYYDPIFKEGMIAPSDKVVRKVEVWCISSNGKFCLRRVSVSP